MGGPTLISYQNMVPANSNQMKSIQPLILFLYSKDEQNLEGEKKQWKRLQIFSVLYNELWLYGCSRYITQLYIVHCYRRSREEHNKCHQMLYRIILFTPTLENSLLIISLIIYSTNNPRN